MNLKQLARSLHSNEALTLMRNGSWDIHADIDSDEVFAEGKTLEELDSYLRSSERANVEEC